MKFARKLRIKNELVRKGLAEFLGTYVLIAFGLGVNMQYVLGHGKLMDYHGLTWGWGLATAMGVWVCGGVSGGHLNPAISLAMAILGKLSWKLFVVYSLMQYLGTIVASASAYGVYYDALFNYTNGTKTLEGTQATASIFTSYPAPYLSAGSAFGDLTFSSFLLVLAVLAITDENNMAAPKGMFPLCAGLIVVIIGMSYGMNCGYALNPARDFGPRLFSWIAGYGTDVFIYPKDYDYFWIPIVSTHVGAIAGSWTYLLLIGNHTAREDEIIEIEPQYNIDFTEMKENDVSHTIDSDKF